ncbi:MAG TPA: bicyclomycin resistance protein, partial [Burkholderiaceae bacterium]|nr:bicyclomycin resistance protein [Burkholderiaceae bacterium]
QYDELWKRTMDSLGLQLRINLGQWPEQLKQARAGKLMMWGLGNAASEPDSDDFLSFGYGPDKGEGNFARFEHPAYDVLYERQHVMPDGPERLVTMQQAVKYLLAYMPYKFHVHPIINDLMHPWLTGFRRHAFKRDFWKYVDIDAAAQARAAR